MGYIWGVREGWRAAAGDKVFSFIGKKKILKLFKYVAEVFFFPLTYYTTMHLCMFKKYTSILKVSFIFFY